MLDGGAGNDMLTGGAGNDSFVFHNGDGLDTVTDFTPGGDTIGLDGYDMTNFAALQSLMTQRGADTVITFDPDNVIILHNVTVIRLHAGEFVFG